ncbi:hypothetical protein Nepgr_000317 [Nepenthes gracilis]|uniref:Phytosulfokine n=1 Tax=Nepenthes gracilis TaxID=150966 RepID=A0AAD3P520_NEPGR|nr:hypothetical protein Nepgr_000317 [Nepenthes gracilis]
MAESMKKTFHSCALIFFFLLVVIISEMPGRLIATKEGEDMELNEITGRVSNVEEEDDDLFKLMGMEVCENGEEECLKRRMESEAHLDYIYTQHHRP